MQTFFLCNLISAGLLDLCHTERVFLNYVRKKMSFFFRFAYQDDIEKVDDY